MRTAMIPQNHHAVICRIGFNAPFQEIREIIRIRHLCSRNTVNLVHSLVIQEKALGPVRIDKRKMPAFGTAGLDDNFDVFRQFKGKHLLEVSRSAALCIGIIRHDTGIIITFIGNRLIEHCGQIHSLCLNFTDKSHQIIVLPFLFFFFVFCRFAGGKYFCDRGKIVHPQRFQI